MDLPFNPNEFPNFKNIFNALLNGGKSAIDNALNQYPESQITRMVEDMYATLNDPAHGSPMGVMDEDKLVKMIDAAKSQMKNPMVSSFLASQVKKALQEKDDAEIEQMLSDMMRNRSLNDQMMMHMTFFQVRPMLDQMRDATNEEIAQQIRDAAEHLPSALIARQLMDLAQEKMSVQRPDMSDKLPAADAISSTLHQLGHAASDALDAAAKTPETKDALNILKQFSENARTIIENGLGGGKGPRGPGRRFNI
jgi:hypothetical protein